MKSPITAPQIQLTPGMAQQNLTPQQQAALHAMIQNQIFQSGHNITAAQWQQLQAAQQAQAQQQAAQFAQAQQQAAQFAQAQAQQQAKQFHPPSSFHPIGSQLFSAATFLSVSGLPFGFMGAFSLEMPPIPPCDECDPEAVGVLPNSAAVLAMAAERIEDGFQRFALYAISKSRDGKKEIQQVKSIRQGELVLVCKEPGQYFLPRIFVVEHPTCHHPKTTFLSQMVPPQGSEIVDSCGPLTVYRTPETMVRLAEWFLRYEGNALLGLIWMERAILLRSEGKPPTEKDDALWDKYQKLKALALQPGTEHEGVAAMQRAIDIARKLATNGGSP